MARSAGPASRTHQALPCTCPCVHSMHEPPQGRPAEQTESSTLACCRWIMHLEEPLIARCFPTRVTLLLSMLGFDAATSHSGEQRAPSYSTYISWRLTPNTGINGATRHAGSPTTATSHRISTFARPFCQGMRGWDGHRAPQAMSDAKQAYFNLARSDETGKLHNPLRRRQRGALRACATTRPGLAGFFWKLKSMPWSGPSILLLISHEDQGRPLMGGGLYRLTVLISLAPEFGADLL